MMKPRAQLTAILGSALLVACGGSTQSAPVAAPTRTQPPPQQAADTAGRDAATEAAPERPTFTYVYDPLGKRDPFRSPAELEQEVEAGQCPEPLCQWDIDQLKLVAVVTGDANPIAMVQDPQGRGHIVRRRTRMGRAGGRVTQILRDSLSVTEYWTGPDGKLNPNVIKLEIQAESRGLPALDLGTGRIYQ